ncbi:hypothetical protein RhiXN_11595 [Rhizoctonia solani]|nr:uncharacterized protein RhiXN_11595 [Rhizoctonia solani]QRW24683.1 hypothetical protein RhiXN_11595 [Rhizoctonia solani]
MLPGYPTDPSSFIAESAYKGGELVGISFDQSTLVTEAFTFLILPVTRSEPFYRVSKLPGGAAKTDPVEAQESLDKMKEMDGHDNVLTIIAHDTTWLDVLKFFPENLNDWKTEGYKARGMNS